MQILKSKTTPIIFVSAITMALLILGILFLWLPDVRVLENSYPYVQYQPNTHDTKIAFIKKPPPGWVSLRNISKNVTGAIITSEDFSFYRHHGVDWSELEIVLRDEIWSGRGIRGASTITQQLAKNVFLSNRKTILRKVREMILAKRIEKVLTKQEILERYLNVIEWGPGLYGIGPATRFYFSKTPHELDAKEGAFLAMLLPNPKKYGTSFLQKELTPYARRTMARILGKMLAAGYLSHEEFAAIKDRPLDFEKGGEELWRREFEENALTPGNGTDDEMEDDASNETKEIEFNTNEEPQEAAPQEEPVAPEEFPPDEIPVADPGDRH